MPAALLTLFSGALRAVSVLVNCSLARRVCCVRDIFLRNCSPWLRRL